MYCPKCKYEYKEGITECPDCNEALVAALPVEEEKGRPEIEMVTLCGVENEIEAAALGAMLASDGIEYMVNSNLLPNSRVVMSNDPKHTFATILVRKDKIEQAREVLEDFKG